MLCVLLLRGPQTIGEIRGRTGRMHEFDGLDEVAEVLEALRDRDDSLVMELPRQPGRKDCRWAHLIAGEPDVAESADAAPVEPARARLAAKDQRIQELSEEVTDLREQLNALRAEFDAFRSQFD